MQKAEDILNADLKISLLSTNKSYNSLLRYKYNIYNIIDLSNFAITFLSIFRLTEYHSYLSLMEFQ